MRALAVLEPGGPAVETEYPTHEVNGKEVWIKITNAGICHSDVHAQDGSVPIDEGRTYPMTREFPWVFGHEIVGTIEAVGPQATLQPGDQRYIVFPWIGCGECMICKSGRENYCLNGRFLSGRLFGGFADHVWIPDEKYLIPLGDLDPSWGAVLACSGVTSYSAVKKLLPADPEDPLAVVGTGGVGMMAVAALSELGHKNIIAVDLSDANLETAKGLGARVTYNPKDVADPAKGLIEAAGEPVFGAANFVNNEYTTDLAFNALRRGGKLVSVGLFGGTHTYPTAMLPMVILTIEGSFVGNLGELQELVDIAKRGKLPKLPITEVAMTAENLNTTLDNLRAGKSRGRTVMVNA